MQQVEEGIRQRGRPARLSWWLTVLLITVMTGFGMSGEVLAQQERPISLQEALQLAKDQNYQLRQAGNEADAAQARYRQTNAVWLPQLSVEEQYVTTNDPLNTFGFKLKQEGVTQQDFMPSRLNDPDRIENFSTTFSVKQPILNPDGIFKRSAAKKGMEAARAKAERTEYYIDFQVKRAYYGLVLARQRKTVIDTALVLARTAKKQASDFYDQGMIDKADYLAANVRVLKLENQQTQAEHAVEQTDEQLKLLLGMKDEDAPLKPTDGIEPMPVSEPQWDLAKINQTRSDMQAIQFRIKAAKRSMQAAKGSFLPKLNAFGNYSWNDDVLFGSRGESYMLGASLQWNLFSGFKQLGKVQEQKIQLRNAKLMYEKQAHENKVELRKARRNLRQAEKQISLTQEEIKQAREQLRIRTNRYEQGMEKTTDLLQAEVALSEARLQHAQALYQYRMSAAHLELLLERPIAL